MNNTYNKIPNLKLSLSQSFHESTKIRTVSKTIDENEWPESWKKIYFKGYPRFPEIVLPKPKLSQNISLKQVLQQRHSFRDFSLKPLKVQDISDLLFYSSNVRKYESSWSANRFYPSAGSRYPLEVYPIILNSEGIGSGVYHYYIKRHSLEVLVRNNFRRELRGSFFSDWINRSGILLFISAVFPRTQAKYGVRGYRHILTEVGHLTQNLYLVATSLKLGCCSIGGYLDDKLNELLDLDGLEESIIGITAIGNK